MDRISRRQVVRGAAATAATTLGAPSIHAQNGRQTLRFVAQVKDGFLRGDHGTEGTPSWLRLEGAIQPDGNATLGAKAITGDPKYTVGNLRQGVPVTFTVLSRFDDSRGTGRRMQHRECAVTFVKQ